MSEARVQLPADWTWRPLKELADVVSGGTPARENPAFWGGDVPWVTPTDITGTKGLRLTFTAEKITIKGLNSSSANLLPKGAVLMTSRATVGESKLATMAVATNQGFKSLVPHANADGLYLLYQMQFLKAKYANFGTGTTFLEVNKKDTEKFQIPVPPTVAEQRGIAEVLSALDEQIEATEASISKRKIILTGLLHDLIPDPTNLRHSPGHSLLGKKAGIRRGASPRPIDSPRWFSGAGRGWVRISDVTRTNRFLAVTEQKLSPAGEACSVAVDPGQVIMSICATVGEPRMVTEPVCIHDGFVVFDRHPELDARYLRHLLVRSRPWFLARGQIGTQSNLNTGLVGSLPIAPPSIDEQELIADAIDNAYDAVDAEIAEAAKLRLQKQGLMRDLLTGKVRVH